MDFIQQLGSLSLGSRLKRLSDHLYDEVNATYQALDIPLSSRFFPLFYLIHIEGEQTITGAANKLSVSHVAISKLSRDMIKQNILSKTTDPVDERRQLLTLGPEGQRLVEILNPVWAEIRQELDQRLKAQSQNLLIAIAELETNLHTQPLAQALIQRCQPLANSDLEILDWDPALRDSFYQLNIVWLQHYFAEDICERDLAQLQQPESYYLAKGGAVLFARQQGRVIGCCALERYSDETYFLTKTAVSDHYQNKGIGRRLVLAALDKARHFGAREVCLETADCLAAANHLYRQLGFVECSPPGGDLEFSRCDSFMRLTL